MSEVWDASFASCRPRLDRDVSDRQRQDRRSWREAADLCKKVCARRPVFNKISGV